MSYDVTSSATWKPHHSRSSAGLAGGKLRGFMALRAPTFGIGARKAGFQPSKEGKAGDESGRHPARAFCMRSTYGATLHH